MGAVVLFENNIIGRTLIRMIAATICGGAIGLERSYRGHTAGFRTHILICLGASITAMTSEYLAIDLQYYTDITRLGAQVIAGVGFIGAGTIVISRSKKIHGLTTAAGLWTTAVIGLTTGAGYYVGAIMATVLVLAAEMLLVQLEHNSSAMYLERNVCIEYARKSTLDSLIGYLQTSNIQITDLEISRSGSDKHHMVLLMTIHLPRRMDASKVQHDIEAIDGVIRVDDLA